MYGYPYPTPCPGALPPPILRRSNPYPYLSYPARPPSSHRASLAQGDDTSTVEYTAELHMQARNASSRLPARRRARDFNPETDIFEDEAESKASDQSSWNDRASIHERPRRASILRIPGYGAAPPQPSGDALKTKPRRKRVSELLAERKESDAAERDTAKSVRSSRDHTEKPQRRRTIYVPSEDTTIMTIHPGAPSHHYEKRVPKSPDFGFDLVTLSEEDPDEIKSVLKKAPTSRKSLAVAPRRAPLQKSSRSVQSVTFEDDKVGTGGGKENLPPGKTARPKAKRLSMMGRTDKPVEIQPPQRDRERIARAPEPPRRTEPITGKKRVSSEGEHSLGPVSKSLKARVNSTATERASTRVHRSPPEAKRRSHGSGTASSRGAKAERPPGKLSVPIINQSVAGDPLAKYPVLSEDFTKPQLYEDNWLSHQEIALTQLLNCLFQSAEGHTRRHEENDDLRKGLLAIYNDGVFTALHKRLQASLQFGALNVPKDLLSKNIRLKDDLGLRRKFLNLWLDTYDLQVLQTAAETIIGRQIPPVKRTSEGKDASRHHRYQRKAIEDYLDVFLIRNEDAIKFKPGVGTIASIARAAENLHDDFGSQAWSWRRTVLRSLMLVLLLDKAKTSQTFAPCLFQTSSSHKSSLAVLIGLGSLALPFLGDIVRPLAHLQYTVQSVQYPLEEYTYRVDNLATDLRDGIVLTRVVELLLYPPSTLVTLDSPDVTITLPTGEKLTTIFDVSRLSESTWVLSHHLKFPCLGRAQKVYNVQIALAALSGVKGIAAKLVEDVSAEDIVDGHREKTLGLLWGLLSRCGLHVLVNRTEVASETRRLNEIWQKSRPGSSIDVASMSLEGEASRPAKPSSTFREYRHVLQDWAQAIGRLHRVRVSNLTTSFADGRAFEAIMDEYLPYCSSPASTSPCSSIAAKLNLIGCSRAFTSLFSPETSSSAGFPIPTKDFTISSLAFLASRLLPLVRTTRAVVAIQRAYRLRLAKREASKRVALMRLAAHCAIVVRTRERIVSAAVVLQRAWRRVLDRRIDELVGDVIRVQSLARGWRLRKGVRKGAKRDRVRGGW